MEDNNNNDEDTLMDDATIGQPLSSVLLSHEDDVSMVGIESGEPLPNPQVDKAVKPKELLDTMSDLSDLEEETDEAKEFVASVNSQKLISQYSNNRKVEGEHLVTVKDPLSKTKGPQSDLLDTLKEGDNEAGRSTNAIDSSDSSEKGKIACPLFHIVEPIQPVKESNQISNLWSNLQHRWSSVEVPIILLITSLPKQSIAQIMFHKENHQLERRSWLLRMRLSYRQV